MSTVSPIPVGMDSPSEAGAVPKTMAAYRLRGTPTLILIDRQRRLRKQKFGLEEDLVPGAEIIGLLREERTPTMRQSQLESSGEVCGERGGPVPKNDIVGQGDAL